MKILQDESTYWAQAEVTCITDPEYFHPQAAPGGIPVGDLKGGGRSQRRHVSQTPQQSPQDQIAQGQC